VLSIASTSCVVGYWGEGTRPESTRIGRRFARIIMALAGALSSGAAFSGLRNFVRTASRGLSALASLEQPVEPQQEQACGQCAVGVDVGAVAIHIVTWGTYLASPDHQEGGLLRRSQLPPLASGPGQGAGGTRLGCGRQAIFRLPECLLGSQPGALPPQGRRRSQLLLFECTMVLRRQVRSDDALLNCVDDDSGMIMLKS